MRTKFISTICKAILVFAPACMSISAFAVTTEVCPPSDSLIRTGPNSFEAADSNNQIGTVWTSQHIPATLTVTGFDEPKAIRLTINESTHTLGTCNYKAHGYVTFPSQGPVQQSIFITFTRTPDTNAYIAGSGWISSESQGQLLSMCTPTQYPCEFIIENQQPDPATFLNPFDSSKSRK